MTNEGGRFTQAVMVDAMHEIARQLGVTATADAQLLRLTNNAVFALPTAGLVIRIVRSVVLHARVAKVVRLAQWFAEIEAPTVRLLTSVGQPLRVGDLSATVWHYVPPSLSSPSVSDLGRSLRQFHSLGAPPFPLLQWDPVREARTRLADAESLSDEQRAVLLDWCGRLAPRLAALNRRAGGGLLHGDAHAGNLVRGPDGHVLLCDFDPTCLGPWQFDLVPTAVGEQRFGREGTHRALAEAYGYDVTADPDWPLLREARELKMITGVLSYLGSTPGVAEEFTIRLRSVVEGDETARWRPYAEFGVAGRKPC